MSLYKHLSVTLHLLKKPNNDLGVKVFSIRTHPRKTLYTKLEEGYNKRSNEIIL